MADYAKVDNTTSANLAKVNNVAKANIAKVNNCTQPSSGATLWVAGLDDAFAAFASNSDLTSWTVYDARSTTATPDYVCLAVGKDASGNKMWCGNWKANNAEVCYTSDPTDSSTWSTVNLLTQGFEIGWGADFWCFVGVMTASNKLVYRSPDGSTWTAVDVSGATDIDVQAVTALTTDGAGNWWFAQQRRIYKSEDHGASWALHTTQAGFNGDIDDLTYTNNTLVVLATGYLYTAASSDTTDFGTGVELGSGNNAMNIASAGGRVVVAYSAYFWNFTVSGKTITGDGTRIDISTDGHGSAKCIATDGTTWLIGCDTGDIYRSTDPVDASSFSAAVLNLGPPAGGTDDVGDIKADVYLPL